MLGGGWCVHNWINLQNINPEVIAIYFSKLAVWLILTIISIQVMLVDVSEMNFIKAINTTWQEKNFHKPNFKKTFIFKKVAWMDSI